jgi:hypothetical protein
MRPRLTGVVLALVSAATLAHALTAMLMLALLSGAAVSAALVARSRQRH